MPLLRKMLRTFLAIASTTCFSFEPLWPIAPVSIPPWPGSSITTRLAPFFFAAGLLCPLDVFNGCCSFALACEAIPESVIAASPAFSTWRREASIFNGLNPNGNWLVGIRDVGAADTGNVVSYTLTVCSQTTTLSSDNFGLEDFTLYPNPNNGNFNIQFTSTSGNEIKVNVHDVRGREIYAKSYTNNGLFNENLQLDTVQSGIYLVTVQDGSRKEVKKIVVQ